MKALVLEHTNAPFNFKDVPSPIPKKGEAIVRIKAAALNHRDLWIQKGQYAGIKTPIILGSDGAGKYNGKKVLINPSLNWHNQKKHPPKHFKILGLPDQGTFAEQVAVPLKNIFPMPAHLSFEEAAALPLAGLTAYRALFSRCKLKPKDKVLISGIGGGVAMMAMQFSVALGAEVWVTSSSSEKIETAIQLGAKGGVNYQSANWVDTLKSNARGFDVLIDGAAGEGFSQLIKLANPGARIGLYGGTGGRIGSLIPQIVFWKQVHILGTTMGNSVEFSKMIQYVNQHRIIPKVDAVFPLKNGQAAFDKMEAGKQYGKLVLEVG